MTPLKVLVFTVWVALTCFKMLGFTVCAAINLSNCKFFFLCDYRSSCLWGSSNIHGRKCRPMRCRSMGFIHQHCMPMQFNQNICLRSWCFMDASGTKAIYILLCGDWYAHGIHIIPTPSWVLYTCLYYIYVNIMCINIQDEQHEKSWKCWFSCTCGVVCYVTIY